MMNHREISDSDPIAVLQEYIANNPRFICPWAKDALEAGKITFAEFPESAEHTERHAALLKAIEPFAKGETSACILVRPNPATHEEGYKKTWDFYADARTACDCIDRPDANVMFTHTANEAAAGEYMTKKNWETYFRDGAIWVNDEALYLISMNELFDEEDVYHAPVFAHILTRQKDVIGARNGDLEKNQEAVQEIGGHIHLAINDPNSKSKFMQLDDEAKRRKTLPRMQGLPYSIPDDPAMDHPMIKNLTKLAQRSAPNCEALADAREEAIATYRSLMNSGDETTLALIAAQADELGSRMGKIWVP